MTGSRLTAARMELKKGAKYVGKALHAGAAEAEEVGGKAVGLAKTGASHVERAVKGVLEDLGHEGAVFGHMVADKLKLGVHHRLKAGH